MLRFSRSVHVRASLILAAAAVPLAAAAVTAGLAACGGGDDTANLGTKDSGGGKGSSGDGSASRDGGAGNSDGGTGVSDAASVLDAGFGSDGEVAQNFDGGPYLVVFGQDLPADGGSEPAAAFHLYDEGTLAPAGTFLVAPAAATVEDVTRDPSSSTWWTTALVSGGGLAAASYDVLTGLLASGPTVLAQADAGVSLPGFAVGAGGTTYLAGGIGAPGLLSSLSSAGAIAALTLPDPSITVNFLAFDSTVGLLAATSSYVSGASAAAPYVLVYPPGQTTATAKPATWNATFPANSGTGGDDVDGGGTPTFLGITALTIAPAGHLVYGLVVTGLAIVDLTASTGSVAALPDGIVPSSGAIPVVTADGAHVLFVGDATDLSRVLVVYDTAASAFTTIADTDGYSFSTELALAGDGARVFGVELASQPSAPSQLVRVDPSAKTLAQTAPLAIDERASLLPRFFAAQ